MADELALQLSLELRATTQKLETMRQEFKLALTEIEERGRRIAAVEGCARGFADLVASFTETTLNTLPPHDQKKLKQLRGEARALGVA